MKIKRFVAKDIRQAMRMVKDELGSDAVIMSNRSVEDGVEIVAARDFDEQAIRQNAADEKTATERPVTKAEAQQSKAQVQLPDFQTEKNKLHVVSSSRKKTTQGGQTKQTLNRGTEQYLGYAEKVNMASPAAKKDVAIKKHQYPASQRPARSSKQFNKNIIHQSSSQQSNAIPEQFMQEMRDEIQSLKSAFDSKISEMLQHQKAASNTLPAELIQRLLDMGFSKKLASQVVKTVANQQDIEVAFDKAKALLVDILPVIDDDLLECGGVVALVGPTGVGKTTTIAKLAAQFILKHGASDVALITTDNYRIGAHEQLSTYGRLLDVPVGVASNAEELRELIEGFSDKKLVLIDTAGMSQRDMRLAEQIQTLKQGDVAIENYLVMSAATQYKSMHEIINEFKVFEPKSCILTKLDETVALGSSLSATIEQKIAISFMTNGQQVPEDIYFPNAYVLIEECVAGLEQENDYNELLDAENWVAESYA